MDADVIDSGGNGPCVPRNMGNIFALPAATASSNSRTVAAATRGFIMDHLI
jgi:hypothetical protein